MGLQLNVDLETNQGPSQQVYIRIEQVTIRKHDGKMFVTTTGWLDENVDQHVGPISEQVLYYKGKSKEGVEVSIPNLFVIDLVKEQEVIKPIVEKKIKMVKQPYVSFDENGDEITLEKELPVEVEEVIGEEKIVERKVDFSILKEENIFDLAYQKILEGLQGIFPKKAIKIV